MTHTLTTPSPYGPLLMQSDGTAITTLSWGEGLPNTIPTDNPNQVLIDARDCLNKYFTGSPVEFDLPVHFTTGTTFQHQVWHLMRAIPYGATRTYGDLANSLNTAARAVGMACGANPIPILVPCHRITAGDGKLGGYSGHHGVDTKRRLLILEGALLPL